MHTAAWATFDTGILTQCEWGTFCNTSCAATGSGIPKSDSMSDVMKEAKTRRDRDFSQSLQLPVELIGIEPTASTMRM